MLINDPFLSDQKIAEIILRVASEIRHADRPRRQTAIRDLSDLCRKVRVRARAAIPVWLELLDDEDKEVGESASYGLSHCAPDSIEPLIEQLRHNNHLVRQRACSSFGTIGKEAVLATDSILPLLEDSAQAVRSRAAWALGLIGDGRQRTIAVLFDMARTGMTEDRRAALHGLGSVAKAAIDLAPLRARQQEIFDALTDEDDDVRWSACYAIESLDLDPATHVDLIVPRLSDRSARVEEIAICQLKELADDVDLTSHLAPICQVVRGARKRSAATACKVIGMLGPRAHAAVPSLIDALNGEDDFTVIAAAVALWRVDGRIDASRPHLARLFPDSGETVCDAISQIGPAATPLIGQVRAALESDDWDLQWAAADALGSMGSGDPATLSALTAALGHDSGIVVSAAATALVRIGVAAVPALSDTLVQQGDPRAEWAADALGRIGPAAVAAAELLLAQLHSSRPGLAAWSAIALAKITGDERAVPMLVKLLERTDRADLRQQAALGLKAVGPRACGAVGALNALLEDPDDDVRTAAEAALSAVTAARH
ncbi:HEAT repeat domain-containing protein [Bradyrhizobium sp. CB3481]|uniref:HEAT repeat domain-containing protein n=1 Tax=Bradyrhizobium sp. CB3481 TaxID=3039158 RepID=UPI0024B19F20|nr:HEAT repeat domain-containing protein [Bradyrhizobium sp. CB3481]WFU16535.1 HEAT repeat domain-containing protein [Bradyrhizobium sp. CB3481]